MQTSYDGYCRRAGERNAEQEEGALRPAQVSD